MLFRSILGSCFRNSVELFLTSPASDTQTKPFESNELILELKFILESGWYVLVTRVPAAIQYRVFYWNLVTMVLVFKKGVVGFISYTI